MKLFKPAVLVMSISVLAPFAQATKCGEVIYNKHGMWRKYNYLPLDLSELIKKHGSISWTSPATTETSTASTDPGVSTGVSDSQTQSVSTRGECKWGGFFGVTDREDFEKYVEQNMNEIKTQMSMGQGGHLEVIAGFMGCSQAAVIGPVMQKNMNQFVDFNSQDAKMFVDRLGKVLSTETSLANQCQASPVASL